jgi:CRP-like cAMP-binding protein
MSAIPAAQIPETNGLLAVLPAAERERLYPHLEPVSMVLGDVVYESGSRQDYVYFPTTSIVSLLYVMEDGSSAEIAVVGNEGMVGVSLFMGGETTPSRAIVQSAGAAFRLSGQLLKREFTRAGPMQHLLLRYTQALLTQMAQTAVCNRHHSVDQQLCRWLLLSLDRLPSNKLTMTQERQHARGAPRRGHGGRGEVAERRPDPLQPGPHHRAGPAGPGGPGLRVLRGGQAGVRPPAPRCLRGMI